MLIPHKYEGISQNMLSVGLDILKILRRRRSVGLDILKILRRRRNVYNLYRELIEMRNDEYELSLNKFFLTLDFLYAVGIITLDEESVVRLR